jgi:1,4-alpha-glucan branching enzyme
MGGTVIPEGATFRVWAPRARSVFVSGEFNQWKQNEECRLQPIGNGHWAGFIAGLKDGDEYLYYVSGPGSEGYKRDPYARKLSREPDFPLCHCVLRNPHAFPWHNTGFRAPEFRDLIIYQLHVGAFTLARQGTHGNFLDVVERLPYLESLGINAVQLLPVVEFPTRFSLGYNGTDYFSPEEDYEEGQDEYLRQYFDAINRLLKQRGAEPYADLDDLRGSDNQLRVLVDLCHVFGIAVLFDVVYNHAGGDFDRQSMYFFDRMPEGNNNDSLYFTDQGWAGGLVYAYWQDQVKQYLIDNAKMFYDEYRIDGIRFDEVSVMDAHGGWRTCQDMTDTLRSLKPEAILIAEYWPVNYAVVNPVFEGGAGFDAAWHDGLRHSVRSALVQAAGGADSPVDVDAIGRALASNGLRDHWRAVHCLENHDIVHVNRESRVVKLADGSNTRSWYARSRSRIALGLLLTAPGIPLLFMGQEFLEDKPWDDDDCPAIWWQGLEGGDKVMADYLRFTQELIRLRRRYSALRGEGTHIIYSHQQDRVLAFQRWVEGAGKDVVVVASLREQTLYDYRIGFPAAGPWFEVFNSDIYDQWVNPQAAGNGGRIDANGGPLHDLEASAELTIPANSLLVFARSED